MTKMDILSAAQQQIQAYLDIDQILKDRLNDVSAILAGGRTPSKECAEELRRALEQHRDTYDAVQSTAAALGQTEGLSIQEYAAVFEEQSKRLSQQKEAADSLRLFLRVRAPAQEGEAIAPIQKAAAEALAGLEQDGSTVDESLLEKITVFLDAVQHETLPSSEGEQLLARIAAMYPATVYHGLIFKKFYFAEEETAGPDAAAGAEIQAAQSGGEQQADKAEPDPVVIEEPVSALSPARSGSIPPSILKRELSQLPRARTILPLFTHCGVLTAEQIEVFWDLYVVNPINNKKGQSVPITLDRLIAKNLLTYYETDGTRMYCLTDYCRNGMDKGSIANSSGIWKLRYGKVRLYGEQEMDAVVLRRFTENNELLLSYLRLIKKWFSNPIKCFSLLRGFIWQKDHYTVPVPWADDMYICSLYPDLADRTGMVLTICEDTPPDVPELEEDEERFCICGEKLLHWENGRWAEKAQEAARQQEPGPVKEEAAEEEPEARPDPDPSDWTPDGSMDARSCAQRLYDSGLAPDIRPEAFQEVIDRLIQEDHVPSGEDRVENGLAEALLLSRSLAVCYPGWRDSCERLVMALDSPIQEHVYTNRRISHLFESDAGTAIPSLKLMTLLRALFAPDLAYDYDLFSQAKALFQDYEANFPGLSLFKSLYNLFLQINDPAVGGFTPKVLCNFISEDERRDALAQAVRSAQRLTAVPTIKSGLQKAMPPMLDRCFGTKSTLGECMAIIASQNKENRDLVEAEYDSFRDENGVVSDGMVYNYYKSNWQWVVEKIGAPKELDQRGKVMEHVRERLDTMGRWLQLTDRQTQDRRLISLRNRILAELDQVFPRMKASCTAYDRAIMRSGLESIRLKLSGSLLETDWAFADCLRTGIFPLDSTGCPDIDPAFAGYRYYEPWRNALRHIAAPVQPLRDVLPRISDSRDLLFYDNIGQAVSICSFLQQQGLEGYEEEQYSADRENSRRTAANELEAFKGTLEQAFAYGRLSSESTKEEILEAADFAWEKFDKCEYYGSLRTLLDALHRVVADETQARLNELHRDIEDRMAKNKSPKLEPVLQMALDKLEDREQNFVVAEEYINRYDSGVSDSMDTTLTPIDNPFLNFVEKDFDELYDLCSKNSSGSLRNFGVDYMEKELKRRKVSAQYQDSSRVLLRNMPNRPDEADPSHIMKMLQELGFQAERADLVQNASAGSTMVRLSVTVQPDPKDRAEYAHPVDIMGTKLRSPMEVICFFGRMQPNDIVDRVCRLELNRTAVVFLNGVLDMPGRRQIAERFHREKSGQNPFLLVDWVLLLYLALHQRTERLPVLLSCSLPYTSSFQPFVTSGSVPDEMFIGRKSELNQILDPKGPVIVYGGRQLGKTALLERAESLANHPEKREYAVLVRAAEYDSEAALVSAIRRELEAAGLHIPPTETMRDLCWSLRKDHRERKWTKLLLLIDEADAVLDAFAAMKPPYKPVLPLSELCRDTGSDFKFVFAGLHDVLRAASDPNTVFGQFGAPLCIRPLRAADALELLSRPLRYLGFTIDPALIEPILVNTSFYPGIVHYVGYCLVENLSSNYANYYSAAHGHPPYKLTERQLGEIINRSDLNDRINDRIRWTLEVDPRYFGLARCIAYLYCDCSKDNRTGHSVDVIMEFADLLDISCLRGLERRDYQKLLEELVEMGILVEPVKERFRLRQRRFQDAIGNSQEKIEQDIRLAEKGEAHA